LWLKIKNSEKFFGQIYTEKLCSDCF